MNTSIFKDIYLFGMEVLHLTLYWGSARVPVKNTIWIFGSWFGETYNDNSKYLFEHVSKSYPEISAVWLSRNRLIVRDLRKRGFKAYYFYNPTGIWYALRAGIAIFSVGYSSDLPGFCLSNSKKLIQLWHGFGIKKVGVMNSKPKDTNQRIYPYIQNKVLIKTILIFNKLLFSTILTHISHLAYKLEIYSKYTYIISLSPTTKEVMAESFAIQKEHSDKIIITGFPRNDVLVNRKNIDQKRKFLSMNNKVFKIISNIHNKGGYVGFYMPTHRQEGEEKILDAIAENLKIYQDILDKENIYLLVKLHQFHQDEAKLENLKNIIIVEDHDLDGDSYPLLPLTDFLVTDYSSIYVDYLLIDKPIIFLKYDFHKYIYNDRSFYFPYGQITPGPKVLSWKQLIPKIRNELQNDSYKKDRRKLKKLFHTYIDNDSSKRVAEKIYSEFVKNKL